MQTHSIKSFPVNKWFYLFVSLHLFAWTLAPLLVRYNLPLDSIEGAMWGHQLEWGYDKNPFLNGWLTALATWAGGSSGWMIYFFSQLSVVVCLFAVWELAKNMLPPIYALIAVMMLEGIQYFNFHAIDFNDNTLELSLWALCAYFFYKALHATTVPRAKRRAWILTGFFAGLGMMAKYYTAALLMAMTLFLLFRAENRKQLTTLSPYLGLLTFLAVITPHCIWLFFHDFITITYVFKRTHCPPNLLNHLYYPAQFAWEQWETFFPACILFSFLLLGRKPLVAPHKIKLAAFDHSFLWVVGLGPLVLTLLLSLCFGIKLRAGWGMPLLSLLSILVLAQIQPRITKARLYMFISAIFIAMAFLICAYIYTLTRATKATSANFPGVEIAQLITRQWQAAYHTPLHYVAGSRWLSGNISFYSDDHPAVFPEWNKKHAPWINVNDMLAKGAVFVWDINAHGTLPISIQKKFPQLEKIVILEFLWKRNKAHLEPIKVGMAFLPPAAQLNLLTKSS